MTARRGSTSESEGVWRRRLISSLTGAERFENESASLASVHFLVGGDTFAAQGHLFSCGTQGARAFDQSIEAPRRWTLSDFLGEPNFFAAARCRRLRQLVRLSPRGGDGLAMAWCCRKARTRRLRAGRFQMIVSRGRFTAAKSLLLAGPNRVRQPARMPCLSVTVLFRAS